MSLFSRLLEYTYADIMKKQNDEITGLFPQFHARVGRVAQSGGILLVQRLPEVWHFKVNSAEEIEAAVRKGEQIPKGPWKTRRTTKSGRPKKNKRYDVYVRFKNIYEMLNKHVPDKSLWVKDGSRVDLTKLADAVFKEVDMETSCSCPASLYWGADYIRSGGWEGEKKFANTVQHGDQEPRPPVVRNPNERGSLCKHGDLVFDYLKNYKGTFAKHLEEVYGKTIDLLVKRTLEGEPPKKEEEGEPAKPGEPKPKAPAGKKTPPPAPKAGPAAPKKPTEVPQKPAEEPGGARPATGPATTKNGSATRKAGPEGGA